MTSPFDTNDWELRILADFHPKRYPKVAECTTCGGSGKIGGGLGWNSDELDTCPTCWGSGTGKEIDPLEPKPEMNEAFTAHMRKAYQDFIKAMPGSKPSPTPSPCPTCSEHHPQ